MAEHLVDGITVTDLENIVWVGEVGYAGIVLTRQQALEVGLALLRYSATGTVGYADTNARVFEGALK